MTQCVEETDLKRGCLKRVLEINLNNEQAQKGLRWLDAQESKKKDRLADAPRHPGSQLPSSRVSEQPHTSSYTIDRVVEQLAKRGWQVIHQTEKSAQLKKPKQWSQIGLLLFVLLPLLAGCFWHELFAVAVLGFLFVLVDYLLRKDKQLYFTLDQIRLGEAPSKVKKIVAQINRGRAN